MKTETVDGHRIIDNPIFRDRLMQLQARVLSMKFNGLRHMTDESAGPGADGGEAAGLRAEPPGRGARRSTPWASWASSTTTDRTCGPKGGWQRNYMFDLGPDHRRRHAQIQKNIISEARAGHAARAEGRGGVACGSRSPKTRACCRTA
jgi:hypothetical protein